MARSVMTARRLDHLIGAGEPHRWDIEVVWLLETVESTIANEPVAVGALAETAPAADDEPAWA